MSDSKDLSETMEALRAEKYPQMSAVLLQEILDAEALNIESRELARKSISQLIAKLFQGDKHA